MKFLSMAKTLIKGKVQTIFDEKRQNSLYKHQFIRVAENGTTNIFDVQFYNEKIKELQGVKEGDEVEIEVNLNGKFWEKEGKSGIFLKLNGQKISICS